MNYFVFVLVMLFVVCLFSWNGDDEGVGVFVQGLGIVCMFQVVDFSQIDLCGLDDVDVCVGIGFLVCVEGFFVEFDVLKIDCDGDMFWIG